LNTFSCLLIGGTIASIWWVINIVEASITNHLEDFSLDLEKYKVVQIFPTWKD
jgi:hypothetical protein